MLRISPGVADATAGVRRLEKALGGSGRGGVAPDGRLVLSPEEIKSLQEVEQRLRETRRQRSRASQQASSNAKEQRALELTLGQVGGLEDDARTYRSVGKMFMLTPPKALGADLQDKLARSKQKTRVCEATLEYLGRAEKEAEGAYSELVRGLKAKRGVSAGGN